LKAESASSSGPAIATSEIIKSKIVIETRIQVGPQDWDNSVSKKPKERPNEARFLRSYETIVGITKNARPCHIVDSLFQ
jgi:hypothetical protein